MRILPHHHLRALVAGSLLLASCVQSAPGSGIATQALALLCTDCVQNGDVGTDDDGDGYCEDDTACTDGALPGDCDDVDAAMSPGEAEQCNGLDDDCDGLIADAATTEVPPDFHPLTVLSFSGAARARGNVYLAAQNTTITSTESYLDATDGDTLTWTVYEGPSVTGPFVQMAEATSLANTSDAAWHVSPALDVPVTPGSYYAVAVFFSADVSYFTMNPAPVPIAVWWGAQQYGIGLTSYSSMPASPSFYVYPTSAYAQRINTGPDEDDTDADTYLGCADDCDDDEPLAVPVPGPDDCDGIDNDCDGTVDNDFDVDGDGATTCGPDGIPGNEDDDCDDLDPTRSPLLDELCDGLDSNCDGGDLFSEVSLAVPSNDSLENQDRLWLSVLEATEYRRLSHIEVYADGDLGEDIDWVVYESSSVAGPHDLVLNTPSTFDSSDEGFQTSPELDYWLQPGMFYAIGARLSGTVRLYHNETITLPLDMGWADLQGSIGIEGQSEPPADTNGWFSIGYALKQRFTVVVDETDADGDTAMLCTPDCDDTDALISPDLQEVCGNGSDDDCDGSLDEIEDADGDGVTNCGPDGLPSADDDCDDLIASMYPGAPEACDGADSDCDGSLVDEFTDTDLDFDPDCTDEDDDNDGDPDTSDCAPLNEVVFTDADELCDELDSDCDASLVDEFDDLDGDGDPDCVDDDADGDTFAAIEAGGDDCNDLDSSIRPSGTEQCDDIDSNCNDSLVDSFPDTDLDDEPDCIDEDDDDDGDPDATDCGPLDPLRFDGALELCDAIDSDCDGSLVDEDPDFDGDGTPDCVDPDDDGDGDPDTTDCEDLNAAVYSGAPEFCDALDSDCDGSLIDEFSAWDSDAEPNCIDDDDDNDGDPDATDCDDADPAVYQGAPESCDGVDSDCDGSLVDEFDDLDGDTTPDCVDSDADGDGHDAGPDCDDTDPTVYPGATEDCDGTDTDCDGSLTDEFTDLDDDGVPDCFDEDQDGDGDPDATDCAPSDPAIYTGQTEIPDDGLDQDCSGADTVTCSVDSDGDGFGHLTDVVLATDGDCLSSGEAPTADDCNDSNATVHPGAAEFCDASDADCDGDLVDSFADTDGDAEPDCIALDDDGDGAPDSTDCGALDPAVHAGADEACDAVDSDCDGDLVDAFTDTDGDGLPDCVDDDLDGDGEPGLDAGGLDCNDDDPDVHPDAAELCDDVDSDCDGDLVDDDLDFDGDGEPDCIDDDDDGDGDLDVDDCDDGDDAIHSGAIELCDGLDNDCDDEVDEDLKDQDWFRDDDGDGFGDPTSPWANNPDCLEPEEHVPNSMDCDDTSFDVRPGADEVCDGFDNDCDPTTHELDDVDGDGFAICDGDCDELDADVNPYAEELCDELDNDCDEATDENGDWDGDSATVCQGDCDDLTAAISPLADEVCGDGIDNDCDEAVDQDDSDCDDGGPPPEVVESIGCQADCSAASPSGGAGWLVLPLLWLARRRRRRAVRPALVLALLCGCSPQSGAGEGPPSSAAMSILCTDCIANGDVTFDNDGDGFCEDDTACSDGSVIGDCDDTLADANPAAAEICDAVDDNCDGVLGLTDLYERPAASFGSDRAEYIKGNRYQVTTTTTLTQVEMWLETTVSGTQITWLIWEAPDTASDYVRIYFTTTAAGSETEAWRSTEPMELPLVAGRAYIVAAYWTERVAASVNVPSLPEATAWGSIVGNYSNYQPLSMPLTLPSNAGSSLAYAQRLYTGYDETDADGDASMICDGDCDDADADVSPDLSEVCANAIDDDCDELIDEDSDDDGDGFNLCTGPDCDDTDNAVYPGAAESCDTLDSNCDGDLVDEFSDLDGDSDPDCTDPDDDGDGDPDIDDCDDSDASVFAGAPEDCDETDSNCDGDLVDTFDNLDGDDLPDCIDDDADGDSVLSIAAGGGDCDDFDASINPFAVELCDTLDSDCDGDLVDGEPDTDGDDEPDCTDADDDGDGEPDGDDCGPLDPTMYSDAPELCDGIDSDCDGDLVDDFDDTDGDLDPDCTDGDDDGDGSADEDDCGPLDPTVWPGAPELCDATDSDCDGSLVDEELDFDADGDPDCTDLDDDGDGDPDDTDCAPLNPAVHADADEACDALDSDCNGDLVDSFDDLDGNGVPDCVDEDADGDGFPALTDCDDLDVDVYPGAPESCDPLDSDCDGSLVDEDSNLDGDDQPDCIDLDVDGDGEPNASDCAPEDPAVFPGQDEVPDDGIDQDCDLVDATLCPGDADGDGYGHLSSTVQADDGECTGPGEADTADDCDDSNDAAFPGAAEFCDAADSDCDGDLADGFDDFDADGQPDCVDTDDDDDGDDESTDCDELDPDVYTGAAELCDAIDSDCDGDLVDDFDDLDGDELPDCADGDSDGDGWASTDAGGDDCDDGDATVHPDAPELCDDVDSDCDDSLVDEDEDLDGDGQPDCVDVDADGDGESDATDCDDLDAQTWTGAPELCDGRDNDCDLGIDEDLPAQDWFADADSDGFGDLDEPWASNPDCHEPAGHVPDASDCDDGDPLVSPGELEVCNGLDDDCDPATNELADRDEDGFSLCDGDCDDDDDEVNPSAEEICDAMDNDCDEDTDEELDGDGDFVTICQDDCDDFNDAIGPFMDEVCDDGIDNDCDGAVDVDDVDDCEVDDDVAQVVESIGCQADCSTASGAPSWLALLLLPLLSRRWRRLPRVVPALVALCALLPAVAVAGPAEDIAVEAFDVNEQHCAGFAAGETTEALQHLELIAPVVSRLSQTYDETQVSYLLYWRGVLNLCINQNERGAEDLRGFLADGASAAAFPDLARQANRRLRMLTRAEGAGAAAPLRRLQIGAGAGYQLVLAGDRPTSHLAISVDAAVRIVGPLHVLAYVRPAISEPNKLDNGQPAEGAGRSILTTFGAGVIVHGGHRVRSWVGAKLQLAPNNSTTYSDPLLVGAAGIAGIAFPLGESPLSLRPALEVGFLSQFFTLRGTVQLVLGI